MGENLNLSRRKDDILFVYYFVCGYICFKEKKKERKDEGPITSSLMRSLLSLPLYMCFAFSFSKKHVRTTKKVDMQDAKELFLLLFQKLRTLKREGGWAARIC